jgi:hypothetical protein
LPVGQCSKTQATATSSTFTVLAIMILWAKLKSIARKQTVGANLRAAAIKYDGKAVADRTDEPFANDRAEDNLNVVGRLY